MDMFILLPASNYSATFPSLKPQDAGRAMFSGRKNTLKINWVRKRSISYGWNEDEEGRKGEEEMFSK